jgi:ABC-type branched-subunit amino acid transport system substrate-binding protein
LLLLAASLGTHLACATLFQRPATEEERRAYARASHDASSGGAAQQKAYEDFLARFPDSALAGDASLELAKLAHHSGDLEEASRRYEQATRHGGTAADRASVQLAALALETGDAVTARRWLDNVRLSRLDDADLRNAYRTFAETSSRPAERVRWLSLLRTKVPDPSAVVAIDLEIDSVLAELSVDELEATASQVGDRPPSGRVFVELADRALAANDVDAAEDALESAKRRPMAPRYAPRLAALEARVRSLRAGPTDVDQLLSFEQVAIRPPPSFASARGAIGVALPLSGPFSRFGEEALEGVLLAAGTFSDADRHPEIRVVVRDTAGNSERAAAAVRELADDPEIVAIVGPLVSSACEAAAREAEEAGIPLLAITAREGVAREREWVFRLRTRPVEEAQLLADRAMALGAERFAILYPNDPYGLGLRGLFWDAVELRGGQVVAVASFDPSATDFGESIRRLVGYTLLNNEEKRLIAQREGMLGRARRLPPSEARALRRSARSLTTRDGRPIPPIVDFDALFLPASHDDLVLIAPQLVFHDLTGARLLGTDGGFDDELLRLASDHIEGALFASHFYAGSEIAYVADFRERFEAAFDAPPGAFAAQSYDAASLVLVQLAHGESHRRDVRDGMLRAVSFPGVSGVLTMRADGNAQKRPYLLGIEQGEVLEYVD